MRKIMILIASLALAACGQNAPAAQPTTLATTVPSAPTALPLATPTNLAQPDPAYPVPAYPAPAAPSPTIAAPPELVQAARERLAAKLGIAPDMLTIQTGVTQQWPDESLGCPAPATTYAKISIPGYLLTFGDSTRSYAVHTSLAATPGEPMVWCDNQQPVNIAVAPTPPTPDAKGQAMFELARADLAKQISVDPASITLLAISSAEWSDTSLGCPQPGVSYLQVITPGYNMRLDVKGVVYEYHTDSRSAVVKCGP